MTLNVNEPTDQRMVSELPGYIRASRVAINAVSVGSGGIESNEVEVAAGAISLSIGTELSDAGIESVILSGAGAAVLVTILGGDEGQIKIFVFQDANISFTDGLKALGAFYLNHLPALSDFAGQQDDVLALINVGGDGTSVNYGYWKELYRGVSVK
jgi:hypothetical protein